MTIKVYIFINNEWVEQDVYNIAEFDERLDEQLDSGSVQIINESIVPFEDFCKVKVVLNDSVGGEKKSYFYAFDTVEKRAQGYHIHALELVEPTRLLMGIFLDGRKVTQPIEGYKKTLREVCMELLSVVKLLPKGDMSTFFFSSEGERGNNIISPEFHWEAGTSLWEALCDIGNVMNAIPRLTNFLGTADEEKMYDHIRFDAINKIVGEYEM